MATVIEPLAAPAVARPRAADYLELTKPRIAVMALITVAGGYLVGAGLVAAGGSALNHLIERRADARMRRTANRPLPAGRMTASEVASYGLTLAVAGVVYLLAAVPHPGAAVAAAATAILYVGVYTPLKRLTTWNTVVGAVPGALPPVIGWAAARADFGWEPAALFAILFVWQLPHFYSIAWMHRDDYARGGMVMLPVIDRRDGRTTGVVTALTAVLLLLVTPGPYLAGAAGWVYLAGAVPLGVWFLARCGRFARHRTHANAKAVLRGSLVYLTGVMLLLAADGILPRYMG